MKLLGKKNGYSGIWKAVFSMTAAFITYCSMYAFRKPFTAGIYADMEFWGIDYKILLITTQVIGYMLSKFIGIKVISEMPASQRIRSILILIGFAWISLFFFAITPYPYNFPWLFLNGLPLGMIWGIVFAFLEGRRNTELLGAGMCVSFIIASGLVKGVGKYLIEECTVDEFWMPFLTGALFVPLLLLGVWMLGKITPPDLEDQISRTKRVPMKGKQRLAFFTYFAPGIIMTVCVYIALTVFRDLRDNFAVEIWTLLGYKEIPEILVGAEIPIAICVFSIIALMILIRNNSLAFYVNLGMIGLGGFVLLVTTYFFDHKGLNPALWMILAGFGMYLSYVSYHTILFERWIALFQQKSNIGFLMYIADAFGYLGSVVVLFIKNFGAGKINWLTYILQTAYIVGWITLLLSVLTFIYFKRKEKRLRIEDLTKG